MNLSQIERENLEKFLSTKRVQKLLKAGGAYAVVFEPSTGIGVPVTAHARSADFSVMIEQDITDYSSW